jgi:hypothetical protein
MQTIEYCHAGNFGPDGKKYVDQIVEFDAAGYVTKTCLLPLKSSDLDQTKTAIINFTTEYFIDSVCNFLPFSNAVLSCNWNLFNNNLYENEQKENESEFFIRNVDVYGVFNSGIRKFIFRKVTGEDAEWIGNRLHKSTPSIIEIVERVHEAIKLTQLPLAIACDRAAWKSLTPIAFYYLPVGRHLEVTIEKIEKIKFRAKVKPLIFVYPILPDMQKEKVKIIVTILRMQFEKIIDIFSIDTHPLIIDEPPTIREVTYKDICEAYSKY